MQINALKNSVIIITLLVAAPCYAADQIIGDVAENVRGSMGDVAALFTAMAYVCGVAFSMMGLFKLKVHKDNPTQVPLSQPMVLVIIGACLIFLPSLIKTAGTTIWGDSKISTGTLGGEHQQGNFMRIP